MPKIKIPIGKIVQFGFQQRFSPEYLEARELVEAGELGELKMMVSFWILGMAPRMTPPDSLPLPNIPEEERRIRTLSRRGCFANLIMISSYSPGTA